MSDIYSPINEWEKYEQAILFNGLVFYKSNEGKNNVFRFVSPCGNAAIVVVQIKKRHYEVRMLESKYNEEVLEMQCKAAMSLFLMHNFSATMSDMD